MAERYPIYRCSGGYFCTIIIESHGRYIRCLAVAIFKLAKTKDWALRSFFMLHLWDLTIYYVAFCVAHHPAELFSASQNAAAEKEICSVVTLVKLEEPSESRNNDTVTGCVCVCEGERAVWYPCGQKMQAVPKGIVVVVLCCAGSNYDVSGPKIQASSIRPTEQTSTVLLQRDYWHHRLKGELTSTRVRPSSSFRD